MNFADAAEQVLRENGGSLSVADITKQALDQGLIKPRSDDPATYVRAAIRKDNRRREGRNEPARFRLTAPGVYARS
jgi:HB1, ASXL, restriction endonuclease HTH domain